MARYSHSYSVSSLPHMTLVSSSPCLSLAAIGDLSRVTGWLSLELPLT